MAAETGDEIKRWRARAEEVRTMADQFRSTDQREQLLRIAEGYDMLARNAEARRQEGPQPRESVRAGCRVRTAT